MPDRAVAWRRGLGVCAVGGALLMALPCLATDVRVVGVTPGRSADVVVNGGQVTLEVGEETPEGVKLLSADRDRAVLRVDGKTRTLSVVAPAPAAGGAAGGSTVVLTADPSGHFATRAFINGRAAPCLIDTGATLTTLSSSSADRLGLDYAHGVPTRSMTVNGVVDGWRVSLDSVRVGDVAVRDVDAVVVDNDALPIVLLGQNFLRRFDIQQQGPKLVLRRRR